MSERQVTIITIAILGVIVLGGGFSIWYFQFNVLAGLQEEVDNVRAQVKDAEKKQKAIPTLQGKVKGLEEDVARVQDRIPDYDTDEYDQFINSMADMSRKAGVVIAVGKPEPKRRQGRAIKGLKLKKIPPNVHQVEYTFVVVGRSYPLLRFINLVETASRFIEVKECEFSRLETTEDDPALKSLRQVKLKVGTYAYKVPAAADDGTAGAAEVGFASTLHP